MAADIQAILDSNDGASAFVVKDSDTDDVLSVDSLGSVTIGAAATANGQSMLTIQNAGGNFQIFVYDGLAENNVTGDIGDFCVYPTTGTVYFKRSGSATNTGWREMATRVPSVDSTENLGSDTIAWANVYVDTIRSIAGTDLVLDSATDILDVNDATIDVSTQATNINVIDNTIGAFNIETNLISVDTQNSRVGIGNAAPETVLHIGIGSPNTVDGANDLYVTGDTEIDGTLYADTIVGTINASLTPGSVAFGSATGTLTQDNSMLYWDNTNNQFGLGTNVVAGRLNVYVPDGIDMTGLRMEVSDTDSVGLDIVAGQTTADVVSISATALQTANVIDIDDADALTTGRIANLVSDSADNSTRTLVQITNDNAAASGATVLGIQQDADRQAVYVNATADPSDVISINAANDAFTGTALTITSDTDAGGAFKFLKLTADANGTPNDVFSIGADGSLSMDGNLTLQGSLIDLSAQPISIALNSVVNALNIDANTLVIDAQNNFIGINNAAPTGGLTVGTPAGPAANNNATSASDVYITGNLEVDGNVWLGDAEVDDITINGSLVYNAGVDLNGKALILDAGGASYMAASVDNVLSFDLGGGGADWIMSADDFDAVGGTLSNVSSIDGGTGNLNITANAAGEVVVNDAGEDVNLRVEAAGQPNALFVQGSDGRIGIGTITPEGGLTIGTGLNEHARGTSDLYVTGNLEVDGSVWLGDDATVDNLTVTGTFIHSGSTDALTIDVTNEEALMVRRDGDTGDVFSVDTVNMEVYVADQLGVNTTTPTSALQVVGDNVAVGDETNNTAATGAGDIYAQGNIEADGTVFAVIVSPGGTFGNIQLGVTDDQTLDTVSGDLVINSATDRLDINTGVWDLTTQRVGVDLNPVVDAFSLDNVTFSADALNHRIGIGTSAPVSVLQVLGDNVTIGTGALNDNATGTGDLYVEGALEVDGSVWLGDASVDNITVLGTMTYGTGFDLNGQAMILDADGDSALMASTDDVLTLQLNGAEEWVFSETQLDAKLNNITNVTQVSGGTGEMDLTATTEVSVNEAGGDVNFRVEGAGQPNALFVQGSDGSVGVNTNAPDHSLTVLGNARISDALSVDTITLDGNTITTTASSLDFGSEYLVTSGGASFDSVVFVVDTTTDRVGIGTSSPTSALQVVGDNAAIGVETLNDNATGSGDLYVQGELEVDGSVWLGDASVDDITVRGKMIYESTIIDLNGQPMILDADGDSAMMASTDDVLTIQLNGAEEWVLSGSQLDAKFNQIVNVTTIDGGTGGLSLIGAAGGTVTVNTNDEDIDFVVKGGSAPNALFVQGSNGYVGVGTSAPTGGITIGDGTANANATGANDIYVQGDLEVDGSIYGTVMSVGGTFGNIQIGVTDDNMIDTTTGDLKLTSQTGSLDITGGVRVSDAFTVDTITIDNGRITRSDATTLDFGDEYLVTSGGASFDQTTFVVDAANNRVGIGTSAPGGGLSIGTGANDRATGTSDLYVTGNLEVDGSVWLGDASVDDITVRGKMIYESTIIDLNGQPMILDADGDSAMMASTDDVLTIQLNGAEEWVLSGSQMDAKLNNITNVAQVSGGTGEMDLTATTEVSVNEAGGDVNFRVEGTGQPNALFVQGSDGRVGIGMDAPTAGLTIGTGTNNNAADGNDLYVSGDLEVDGSIYGVLMSVGGTFGNIQIGVTDDQTIDTVSGNLVLDSQTNVVELDAATLDMSAQNVAVTLSNAAGALNIDSDTLVIDALTNKIGIATNDPDATLTVTGSSKVSGVMTVDTITIDGNAITSSSVSIDFGQEHLVTAGGGTFDGTTLVIDAANNRVGIGTSAPSSALTVIGDNAAVIASNETGNNYATGSGDLYVEGDLEVDGSVWLGDAAVDNITIYGTMIYENTMLDLNGQPLILDADGDSAMMASTDDVLTFQLNGSEEWVLSGSQLDAKRNQIVNVMTIDGGTGDLDLIGAAGGAVTVNTSDEDVDFVVRGGSAPNALFVQGSNGYVGVGTSAPTGGVTIGAGTANDNATGANDIYVQGDLEVDGSIFGSLMSVGGTFGNIQIGITDDNTIDTTSGDLKLASGTGSIDITGVMRVSDALTVDTITIDNGRITRSDATTLDFGDEYLVTSGGGTFDGTTLVIDAANNRVGVGTSAPATQLEVQAASGADATITLKADAGEDATDTWQLSANDGSELYILNSTSTLMTIESDGDIFVGASLADQLHDSVEQDLVILGNLEVKGSIFGPWTFANIQTGVTTDNRIDTVVGTGGLELGSAADVLTIDTVVLDMTDNAVSMTLNQTAGALSIDGNTLNIDALNNRVGIGTSAPDSPLHVVGGARVSDALTVDTVTIDNGRITRSDATTLDFGDEYLVTTGGGTFDGTTFVIDAANNRVGVGTSAPSSALTVIGDNAAVIANNETNNNYATGSGDLYVEGDLEVDGSVWLGDAAVDNITIYGTMIYENTLLDLNGQPLILDADGDSAMMASTDDVLTIQLNGAEEWVLSGSQMDAKLNNITNVVQVSGGTGEMDLAATTEISVNEAGADVNFRVEGTGQPNALFVQGNDGRVGVGMNAPTAGLTIGTGTNTNATGADDLYVTGDLEVDGNIYGTLLSVGGTFGNVQVGVTDDNRIDTVVSTGGLELGSAADVLTIDTVVLDMADNAVSMTLNQTVGALSIDGSTLNIDALNNRVGIGTSAPDSPLHVVGGARVSDALTVDTVTIDNGRITRSDATTLDFGDEYLVTSGGASFDMTTFVADAANNRVGIGTSAPTSALTVTGDNLAVGDETGNLNATGAGSLYVQNNLEVDGNVWLGDVTTDTITITGGMVYDGVMDLDGSPLILDAGGASYMAASVDNVLSIDLAGGGADWIFRENDLSAEGGTVSNVSSIDGGSGNLNITANAGGEVVVNEDSDDVDLRIESDNSANALFVRGSDGYVGVGTATVTAGLTVGDGTANALATGANDLYVQGDLEVDGSIYGTLMSVGGTFGNIQIGITDDNTIDTKAGDLKLTSTTASVDITGAAHVSDVLTVDTITLDGGSITDSTGRISFGNEHLVTTGSGTFAAMLIDQTANAVALNIDSAATTADILTVDGTALTTGRALQINVDDSMTSGKALQIFNATTGTIVLSADDEHVGIGTSAPTKLLQVAGKNAVPFEYITTALNTYRSTVLVNGRSEEAVNQSALTAYMEANIAPADSYAGIIAGYRDYDGSEPNLVGRFVFGVNAVNYFDGNDARSVGFALGGFYSNRTGAAVANLAIDAAYGIFARSFQGSATVTDSAGVYIDDASLTGGSIANNYGLYIANMDAGTNNYAIRSLGGQIVFNDDGLAVSDFRVEGDTQVNLLYTDASADAVGIGTATPTARLSLSAATPVLFIDANGATTAAISIDAENTTGDILSIDATALTTGQVIDVTLGSAYTSTSPVISIDATANQAAEEVTAIAVQTDADQNVASIRVARNGSTDARIVWNETADAWSLDNGSGTLAAIVTGDSPVGSYVPYNGATTAVNLGVYGLTASSLNADNIRIDSDTITTTAGSLTIDSATDMIYVNAGSVNFSGASLVTTGTATFRVGQVTDVLTVDTITLDNGRITRSDATTLDFGDEYLVTTGGGTFDGTTFVIDAANNRVGVGTSAPTSALQVVGDNAAIGAETSNTHATGAGDLYVEGDLEVDGSVWLGDAAVDNITIYGTMIYENTLLDLNGQPLILDADGDSAMMASTDDVLTIQLNGAEEWVLSGSQMDAKLNNITNVAQVSGGTGEMDLTATTEVSVNEAGADVNFRVEGAGQPNALFVQGSDGYVGIGTTAPVTSLDVAGPVRIDTAAGGLFIDSGATTTASALTIDASQTTADVITIDALALTTGSVLDVEVDDSLSSGSAVFSVDADQVGAGKNIVVNNVITAGNIDVTAIHVERAGTDARIVWNETADAWSLDNGVGTLSAILTGQSSTGTLVPYTGATLDVDLGEHSLTANALTIDDVLINENAITTTAGALTIDSATDMIYVNVGSVNFSGASLVTTGTATFGIAHVTDVLTVDTITLDGNAITTSADSLDFGSEYLVTTGGGTFGTLTIASGSITDSANTIDFGGAHLVTTGSSTVSDLFLRNLTGQSVLATNASGQIVAGSLGGYVPYSGATNEVDLGMYGLTAGAITIDGINVDNDTITTTAGALTIDSATDMIYVNAGSVNFSGASLVTTGTATFGIAHVTDVLTVDTITIDNGRITRSDATTLDFGDEYLVTTGGGTFDGTTFVIDAANNRVGVGTSAPTSALQVVGDNAAIGAETSNTHATGAGDLYVEGDLEVDGSVWLGDAAVDNITIYGTMIYENTLLDLNGQPLILDADGDSAMMASTDDVLTIQLNGTEEWILSASELDAKLNNITNVTQVSGGTGEMDLTATTEVSVNEAGADVNFRVEGAGQPNALFVQGSDGYVGIGTTAPVTSLDVAGPVRIATNDGGLFIDSGATTSASVLTIDASQTTADVITIDATALTTGNVLDVKIDNSFANASAVYSIDATADMTDDKYIVVDNIKTNTADDLYVVVDQVERSAGDALARIVWNETADAWSLDNGSGTLAAIVTAETSTGVYVPYVGATQNVDLNLYGLTASSLNADNIRIDSDTITTTAGSLTIDSATDMIYVNVGSVNFSGASLVTTGTATFGIAHVTDVLTVDTITLDGNAITSSAASIDFGGEYLVTTGGGTFDGTTFVIDAANNRVGVGTSAPASALQVVGDNAAIGAETSNTHATGAGDLYVEGDLEVDGSVWLGDAAVDNITIYGMMIYENTLLDLNGQPLILDAGGASYMAASVDNVLSIDLAGGGADWIFTQNDLSAEGGTLSNVSSIDGNATGINITADAGQEVVINIDGEDVNLRVEAVGQPNALFVQGSDGHVGIGTTAPVTSLDVAGPVRIDTASGGLFIDSGATTTASALTIDASQTTADVITIDATALTTGNVLDVKIDNSFANASAVYSIDATADMTDDKYIVINNIKTNTTDDLYVVVDQVERSADDALARIVWNETADAWSLDNGSGTLAAIVTAETSTGVYVPYVGATQNVDLNLYGLTASSLVADNLRIDSDTITTTAGSLTIDSATDMIYVNVGSVNFSSASLVTTGTVTFGIAHVTDVLTVDTITLEGNAITSSAASIDFGGEYLVTTGGGTFGTLTIGSGSITDSANTIDFGGAHLVTTGSSTVSDLFLRNLTGQSVLATNASGQIVAGSLGGYVPYSGATNEVDLGMYGLTAGAITIDGINVDNDTITTTAGALTIDSATDMIYVNAGSVNFSGASLVTTGTATFGIAHVTDVLTVDTITLDGNAITTSAASIDFGGEYLVTTGGGTFDGTTLVINAATDRVGIGTSAPTSALQVVGDNAAIGAETLNTHATGAGDLYVEGDLEVDGSVWLGDAAVDNITIYGTMIYENTLLDLNGQPLILDADGDSAMMASTDDVLTIQLNGAEEWILSGTELDAKLNNITNVTQVSGGTGEMDLAATTEVSVNEAGADVNFRVEGAGQPNALFVQGSDGYVGIGTTAPVTSLDVAGPVRIDTAAGGLFIDSGATTTASALTIDASQTTTDVITIDATALTTGSVIDVEVGDSLASGSAVFSVDAAAMNAASSLALASVKTTPANDVDVIAAQVEKTGTSDVAKIFYDEGDDVWKLDQGNGSVVNIVTGSSSIIDLNDAYDNGRDITVDAGPVTLDATTSAMFINADGTDVTAFSIDAETTTGDVITIDAAALTTGTVLSIDVDSTQMTAAGNAIYVANESTVIFAAKDLNVGIGTSHPRERLEVNNAAVFTSEYDNGTQNTDFALDWSNGNKQAVTLSDDGVDQTIEVTLSGPDGGVGNLLLRIKQGDASNMKMTWSAAGGGDVKWPSGAAPTLTDGIDSEDIVTCFTNGTDYYCAASLDFQ